MLQALEWEEAKHLLSRADMGHPPSAIQRLLPLSRAEAVDLLISEAQITQPHDEPAWRGPEAPR